MAHYSDEDARRVFNRDMSAVHAAYAEQARQQRPARERARDALLGQQGTPEHEAAAPVVDEDPDPDEDGADPGEIEA